MKILMILIFIAHERKREETQGEETQGEETQVSYTYLPKNIILKYILVYKNIFYIIYNE